MPRTVHPQALCYLSSVILRFPYDAGLVEAIKDHFPAAYRSYDPHFKQWTIKAPYVDAAVALLQRFFPDATVKLFGNQGQQEPPPYFRQTAPPTSPYAALHLLDTAPPEVVRAAYNALAKRHHPDVAAPEQKLLAHQAMLKINAAIAQLRERGAA